MNINAPLASLLKVEIYQEKSEVGFVLGANLGDVNHQITVHLDRKYAVVCAQALRQAESLLAAGKPGTIDCRPYMCIVMDIDPERGGIVLCVHMTTGEHYFFLDGSSTITQCADTLLAAALKLQMSDQEKVTWH